MVQLEETTIDIINRTVDALTTRLKVSWSSIPAYWWLSRATRRAL